MNKWLIVCLAAGIMACNNASKSTEETKKPEKSEKAAETSVHSPLLGSYAGNFGDNKITIMISRVTADSIEGNSVVGGNDRPFAGTYTKAAGKITATAKEPGDHKNDGVFHFTFDEKQTDQLSGNWAPNVTTANSGSKDFSLARRQFVYMKDVGKYPDASRRLLTEDDIAGFSKENLEYMRNEIFARHGYCFRKKNLRQQFEDKDWYIPTNTDVKDALTDIEKKNIAIIKRFEKYMEEFGDEYGR